MEGAQTGIYQFENEDFNDYNCPEPEMTEEIENYFKIFNLFKSFLPNLEK